MRFLLLTLLTVLAFGFGAATASSAGTTIRVKDDVFSPKSASMTRNSSVTFRWVGRSAHNVIVTSGPSRFSFSSRTRGSRSKKLTRRGTYSIVCSLHSGMSMKLRVR